MISVSNEWVSAHKETLLPEMFIKLTYGATEPGLQQDATASTNGETEFSQVETVVNGEDKFSERYGNLEHGLWGLDGGVSYFDETPVDPGFVSDELSDENGTFSDTPTIVVDFSQQHVVLVPGITLTWSETYTEWAVDFRVTAYNAGVPVAQTTVTGNSSPVSPVWLDLLNYNRVVVEILSWSHPHHRARCIELYMGIRKVYTKDDLLGFEHKQSADLLSDALPKNAITFRLRNEDDRWNPDNPTGSERYLMEQQEVELHYGMTVNGNTEWIKGGTYWLTEWETPANGLEAVFTARDALAFMNGDYTGPRSGSLYDIAMAALEQAALPSMGDGSPRYFVAEVLDNYTTDLTADNKDYTIAQVLQMVAHAGCCVIHQDREGKLHIEPWLDQYSGYIIDPNISFTYPEYKIEKPLRSVAVTYGNKQTTTVIAGASGEVQKVSNPMVVTQEDALRVGNWTKELLTNRKVISGEFRADVRLDVLDNIIVASKYASNIIGVTDIEYSTTGGAIRGKYTGRVVSIDLKPADRRSGELRSGEV